MSTILVADDNSNIQKMVTLALKDEGIAVVSVGNGEAAIRKIPEISPDLVLADIFMPVRSGYEVCEFVKHDPRFSHVPVILLVGAFDPLDEHEAERVGADGVLKKPFVPPDPLITLVKGLLAKSASEHIVPVAEPERVPVGVSSSAPAAAPAASAAEWPVPSSGASASAPASEPPADDFQAHPAPIAFREGEKPVAWSDLLETPAAESDPKTPREPATSFAGAGLGEMRFWQSVAEEASAGKEEFAWGGKATALPQRDEEVLLHPVEPDTDQPSVSESSRATPVAEKQATARPQHAPSSAEGVEQVSWGTDPLPWGTVKETPKPVAPEATPRNAGPLHADGSPGEATPAAQPMRNVTPSEVLAKLETPPETSRTEYRYPGGYVEEMPVKPKSIEGVHLGPADLAEVQEPTLETGAGLHPGAFLAELPAEKQLAAAETPRTSASSYPTEAPAPALTVPGPAAPAASEAQPADAAMVEAVVARVIEKMQPQILEIVTREILKPVAEALVRRELEKH